MSPCYSLGSLIVPNYLIDLLSLFITIILFAHHMSHYYLIGTLCPSVMVMAHCVSPYYPYDLVIVPLFFCWLALCPPIFLLAHFVPLLSYWPTYSSPIILLAHSVYHYYLIGSSCVSLLFYWFILWSLHYWG